MDGPSLLFAADDVTFTLGSLAIITTLGLMLTGTIAYLFKLLMQAKDDAIALAHRDAELKAKELELKTQESKNANTLAMAQQATTNLEIAASRYAASVGKLVPDALVAIVPAHSSPTTKEQREDAERQTLQARITAASLTLDLPARHSAPMETLEDAAIRQGRPQPTQDTLIMDELGKIRLAQDDAKAKDLIKQIAPAPAPVEVVQKEGEAVSVKIESKEVAKAVVDEMKKEKENQ